MGRKEIIRLENVSKVYRNGIHQVSALVSISLMVKMSLLLMKIVWPG